MIPLDLRDEGIGNAPRLLAEINVTPFIDVMLVLLIIFMVAAPLMMVGVPLKLPKTAAQAIPPQHKPVIVSLDKDGHLFLDREEATFETLPEKLSEMVKADPDLAVYVRGDKTLDYGRIMDLLGKVGAGGVVRLSLVAEGQPLPAEARP